TELLLFGGIFAGAVLLYLLLGVNCPTKLFLKIDCPFCGMTRAHLAALRLDFKAAFGYHPFFFLGIPYLFLITHDDLFKGKWKLPYQITVVIMTALLVLRCVLQFF
ncbi:MAG: DUF2752 domain-containing protein, partial [Clostridia bacterium]|nr:DUF2752 domain-containing protein [Clostridia bacterium]